MKISLARVLLEFKFDAGTSRGVLKTRKSWVIKLADRKKVGLGEVAPLKGLSVEGYEDFEEKLLTELLVFRGMSKGEFNARKELFSSSTLFGLESALLNFDQLDDGKVFDNSFYAGESELPINGLIWMGSSLFMKEQIQDKLELGYSCIKMKIGALDFSQEYKLLKELRENFPSDKLTLRVDANGGFDYSEAINVIGKLEQLNIHSIEQPIKAGQLNEMEKLCQLNSSVGVALDEELIGIRETNKKILLLDKIKPQYIILKPTLHGGISGTREWISLAEERNIKWWITSALESNIGLNAICQFADEYNIVLPQGLGTGSLYTNNITSPLEVVGEKIRYEKSKKWDYSTLEFKEV